MATFHVIAYVLGASKVTDDILSQIDSFHKDSSKDTIHTTLEEIAHILRGIKDKLSKVQNTDLSDKTNAARLGVIFESLLNVQKSLSQVKADLDCSTTVNSGLSQQSRLTKILPVLRAQSLILTQCLVTPTQPQVGPSSPQNRPTRLPLSRAKTSSGFEPRNAQAAFLADRASPKLEFDVLHPRDGTIGYAAVDIVFVHGLNGHPRTTWSGSTTNVLWPQSFLPNSLRQPCRVLTYDHTSAYQQAQQKLHIEEIADIFLQALQLKRKACPGRNIIFVAHSLGGILVKVALTRAWDAFEQGKDSLFTGETRIGLVFLGTPHTFSSKFARASLYQTMAAVAKESLSKPFDDPAESVISFNEMYPELSTRFKTLVTNQNIHVYSFFEQSAVVTDTGPRILIDSFMALHHPLEQLGYLPGDHNTLCKFDHPADQGYIEIVRALRSILSVLDHRRAYTEPLSAQGWHLTQMTLLAQSSRKRPAPPSKNNEILDDQMSIQSSQSKATDVEAINYPEDFSELRMELENCLSVWKSTKAPGSSAGQWILNCKNLDIWYKDVANQILCITGPPGCGKSKTTETLYDAFSRSDGQYGSRQRTCIHLTFKGEETCQHNLSSVLKAFCAQVLDQHPFLTQMAVRKTRHKRLSRSILMSLFNTLLEHLVKTPIYVFVDAIDECNRETVQQIVDVLRIALQLTSTRLIISYHREVQAVAQMISDSPSFRILNIPEEGGFQQALILHIENALENPVRELPVQNSLQSSVNSIQKGSVQEFLSKNHQNSFSWIDLALENIQASSALITLPTSHQLYRIIIKRVRENSKAIILALSFITCAFRPLRLEDLEMCVGTKSVRNAPAAVTKELWLNLRDQLGQLVYLDGEGIHLANNDLQSFLVASMKHDKKSKNQLMHEFTQTHLDMGKTCLQIMIMFLEEKLRIAKPRGTANSISKENNEAAKWDISSSDDIKTVSTSVSLEKPLFVEYAESFWSKHLQASGQKASEVNDLIETYFELVNKEKGGQIISSNLPHGAISLKVPRMSAKSTWEMASPVEMSSASSFPRSLAKYGLAQNIKAIFRRKKRMPEDPEKYAEDLLKMAITAPKESFEDLIDLATEFSNQLVASSVELIAQIRNGDMPELKRLLGKNPELDDKTKDVLLSTAVGSRNRDVFAEILDYISSMPGKLRPEASRFSSLSEAVLLRDSEMVSEILRKGRQIVFDLESSLRRAIEVADLQICRSLIDYGADVNASDEKDQTPLHTACADGKMEIVEMLVAHRARTSAADKKNKTPLHLAAEGGHTNVVEFLLRNSSSSEEIDNDYRTPLFLACAMGKLTTARVLWKAGSSLFHRDDKNRTALHAAAEKGFDRVVVFLISAGCRVTSVDKFKNTPLHEAAGRGWSPTVDKLLEAGAPVNAQNHKGETPLHYACMSSNAPEVVVKKLLDSGANPRCEATYWNPPEDIHDYAHKAKLEDTHRTITHKETPLHFATRHKNLKVITLLLSKGVRDDVKNSAGQTALDLAYLLNFTECQQILEDHGKRRNLSHGDLPQVSRESAVLFMGHSTELEYTQEPDDDIELGPSL